MRWSWRVGSIAGIGIYIHFTFLILVFWLGAMIWAQADTQTEAITGIVAIIMVFAVVLLHELGHALTGRRFGVRTRDITLLPIGGVARLEQMPDDPIEELLVALAGPAVNIVLAGIGTIILVWLTSVGELLETGFLGAGLLVQFLLINVLLAGFNLLPAFPMDGGRVLRAALAIRLDYITATNIAASVGQGMAVLFGLAGLLILHNPILIFIALFIWIGAAGEASMAQMRGAFGGIPVSKAMITDFVTLHPDDAVNNAVDHLLTGFQQDFPVVENGAVVGVLPRNAVMRALQEQGNQARVGDYMATEFESAEPSEMLENVFMRLQSDSFPFMPVVRNGLLVGILTSDNLTEFVMINSALRHRPGRSEAKGRPRGSGL